MLKSNEEPSMLCIKKPVSLVCLCIIFILSFLNVQKANAELLATSNNNSAPYASGYIIVRFNPGYVVEQPGALTSFTASSIANLYAKYGVNSIQNVFSPVPAQIQNGTNIVVFNPPGAIPPILANDYIVYYNSSHDPLQVAADFNNDQSGMVSAAQVDYTGVIQQSTPNDPGCAKQWDMQRIQAPLAWNITQGDGVVVAVMDTGVVLTNPDIAPNLWVNPYPGLTGHAKDNNGWNFVSNNNNVADDNGHGTFVAGIAGAACNNGIDMCGTAPNVKIMPVKVLNSSGAGQMSTWARGIQYAVDNGANVINSSLGCSNNNCPSNPVVEDAVMYAYSKNVVNVMAAGNWENTKNCGETLICTSTCTLTYNLCTTDVANLSPQNMSQVIAVGATDNSDSQASYSNYGAGISVWAPGAVYSLNWQNNSSLKSSYGTSFAAPHVSGVAALVESVNAGITPDGVKAFIQSSADNVNGLSRLNAFKAVDTTQAPLTPPAFQTINTCQDLQNMTATGNYMLGANIDCSGVSLFGTLSSFSGTLNGNGFTITNLTNSGGGLFNSLVGANISNLNIKSAAISNGTNNEAGILAGTADSASTIVNVHVQGNVTGAAWFGGGLVGFNYGFILQSSANVNVTADTAGGLAGINVGFLNQCASQGTVTGTGDAGGLAGVDAYNDNGSWLAGVIGDSYSLSQVTLTPCTTSPINGGSCDNIAGGLTGGIASLSAIFNTYASGLVSKTGSAKATLGGLVGKNLNTSYGFINASYWDKTTTKQSTSAPSSGGSGSTAEATSSMQAQATYAGWDFHLIWQLLAKSYPVLFSNSQQYIYTCQDLQNIQNNLGGYYVLGQTIDCSASNTWNGGLGFIPLGVGQLSGFTGVIDGAGFTIKNLTINGSYIGGPNAPTSVTTSTPLGLISTATGAIIRNLNIQNANITRGSSNSAAIVAGQLYSNSVVENVQVQGTVATGQGTASAVSTTGGITTFLSGSTITASSANVTLDGGAMGQYVGGLAAEIGSTSSAINYSYSTGTINGVNMIGGLVGFVDKKSSITVSNSYSKAAINVNPSGTYSAGSVGGLVGTGAGKITTSFAAGPIACSFSCTSLLGGLVGGSSGPTETYSYWDTQVTNQAKSNGTTTGGLTTAQMYLQTSYNKAFTSNIWRFPGNDYPHLNIEPVYLSLNLNAAPNVASFTVSSLQGYPDPFNCTTLNGIETGTCAASVPIYEPVLFNATSNQETSINWSSSACGPAATNCVFTPDTDNIVINLQDKVPAYPITASTSANGSISPSGSVNVIPGANQTFTITANAGYGINQVLVDGTAMALAYTPIISYSYTFNTVTAAHTISASFVLLSPYNKWKILNFTPAQLAVSTISGDTATPAKDGIPNLFKYAFNLQPFTAYSSAFQYYLLNNHFTIVYRHNLNATDMTYQIGAEDSVTGPWDYASFSLVSQNIDANTQQVTATDWVDSTTVTMRFFKLVITLNSGQSMAASLAANPSNAYFSITARAGRGGTISPPGIVKVKSKANQSYTVIPKTGYTANLTIDGTTVALTNNTYTLNDVIAEHKVVASFTPKAIVNLIIRATANHLPISISTLSTHGPNGSIGSGKLIGMGEFEYYDLPAGVYNLTIKALGHMAHYSFTITPQDEVRPNTKTITIPVDISSRN